MINNLYPIFEFFNDRGSLFIKEDNINHIMIFKNHKNLVENSNYLSNTIVRSVYRDFESLTTKKEEFYSNVKCTYNRYTSENIRFKININEDENDLIITIPKIINGEIVIINGKPITPIFEIEYCVPGSFSIFNGKLIDIKY